MIVSKKYLKLGFNSLFYCVERYERLFGRGAYANFCVTRAMKNELAERWSINAHVLYDRAPEFFRPVSSTSERHTLFKKLESQHVFERLADGSENTLFTRVEPSAGQILLRADRPALVSLFE